MKKDIESESDVRLLVDEFYGAIRNDGTQQRAIERMQTRAELYDVLGYHEYEQKLDELFGRGN